MIPTNDLEFLGRLPTGIIIKVEDLRVYDLQITPIFRGVIVYKMPEPIIGYDGFLITGGGRLFSEKGFALPNEPLISTKGTTLPEVYGRIVTALNELGSNLANLSASPLSATPILQTKVELKTKA